VTHAASVASLRWGGSLQLEQVAHFERNGWLASSGMGGHHSSESATFGILSPLLHGAASVDYQCDVGEVGFHGVLLSDWPGGPVDRKDSRGV
jgi:hypothetical protein